MITTTLDLVADLRDAFPKQVFEAPNAEAYVRELRDIPLDTLGAALNLLIRTSDFLPTVAEVRRTVAEITLQLPSEEDALSQIERRITLARDDDAHPTLGIAAPVHADVKRALDHVGGYHAFRSTSDPQIIRGQFLRIYRDLREQKIRQMQIADFPPAQPALQVAS